MTDSGVNYLGNDYKPLPTGDELREYWLNRLPEGERAILAHLIDQPSHADNRMNIETVTGYKKSTRDAYIQRLGIKKLVYFDKGGDVTASHNLFSIVNNG